MEELQEEAIQTLEKQLAALKQAQTEINGQIARVEEMLKTLPDIYEND